MRSAWAQEIGYLLRFLGAKRSGRFCSSHLLSAGGQALRVDSMTALQYK